jgi:hypothetical protein
VERIIHGSDLPVPIYGHFPWLRGLIDWQTFRRWQKEPNVLERDYQLKRAMGFPPETFTRLWTLLRLRQKDAGEAGPKDKKTGLVSQGVTEEPGEFSN